MILFLVSFEPNPKTIHDSGIIILLRLLTGLIGIGRIEIGFYIVSWPDIMGI